MKLPFLQASSGRTDEYVEKKLNQFYGEAGLIVAALMLLDLIIRGGILHKEPSEYMVSGIGFIVYAGYILLRYLLSGMEHPDISNKRVYRKKRKEITAVSACTGLIFLAVSFLFTGFDALVLAILFTIFYFMVHFISLSISYRKNKDIFDDE
ncbi:DUF6773 family protein [Bacillus atrophaeus]|uniref:DUF6773 family protein n=1 Tax=Bacillus atrophaeus TaxID=1452 RepID=UPI002E1BC4D9|nr:hypothetical protein [Bacillus atrophaeus]MED4825241.1 hypothetical protein [Bacillus atrophaeus]MED4842055.1 hypothetical protein [Bacillus atrophaeus]